MKALFSRLTGGNGKSKDRLIPDTSSDTRSFKDKAQPPIPLDTASSSLTNTPSIPERELPPITTSTDNIGDDHSILGVPANMLSPPQATLSQPPPSGYSNRQSLAVDNASLRPPREATRRASQQHLPSQSPQIERITSRTQNTNSLSSGNTGSGSGSKSNSTDSPQPDAAATAKKVAFLSPAPTTVSIASPAVDRPASPRGSVYAAPNGNGHATGRARSPQPSGSLPSGPGGRHVSDPPLRMGGYTPGAAGGNAPRASNAAATLNASNVYLNEAASMRSGTPLSYMSGRTGIQAAASWSEAAEGDLVSNLGSRERTRQEVLWEIVASEDRCVQLLVNFE